MKQKKQFIIKSIVESSLFPALFSFCLFIYFRLQPQLKKLANDGEKLTSMTTSPFTNGEKKGSSTSWELDVEKQLQAWRENPSWTDKPPQIKVHNDNHNIKIEGHAFHFRYNVQ